MTVELQNQPSGQFSIQLWDQLDVQLKDLLCNQLRNQLYSQLSIPLWCQLISQLKTQLCK